MAIKFKGFRKNEELEETEVKEVEVVSKDDSSKVAVAVEPAIDNKAFRWNKFYLMEEFRDILLSSTDEKVVEEKVNEFMNDKFGCPVMGEYELDTFRTLIKEDFATFRVSLLDIVNNPERKVTQSDFWKLTSIYAVLLHEELLPKSEMTEKIGISLGSNGRPILPNDMKENAGIYFNKILVILNEYFESIQKGYLKQVSENDEKLLIMEVEIYSILITVLERQLSDLVSNAKEDSKLKHYSQLTDENGEIINRKIDGFDIPENKTSSNSNNNSVEVDLSNLSTTNSRKEVTSEFESKNNDSEELPNLERI